MPYVSYGYDCYLVDHQLTPASEKCVQCRDLQKLLNLMQNFSMRSIDDDSRLHSKQFPFCKRYYLEYC